jgi:hypothetical protein
MRSAVTLIVLLAALAGAPGLAHAQANYPDPALVAGSTLLRD